MTSGSCLCGSVRWQLDARPEFINHCHCQMCRKASGAAFGSFAHGDGLRFRWVQGHSIVTLYQSSPGNFRNFCSKCGSRVPVLEADGTEVIIPAGTFDDDPAVRPIVHFHVESMAPWYEITDTLPQFSKFPPDSFWTEVLSESAGRADGDLSAEPPKNN